MEKLIFRRYTGILLLLLLMTSFVDAQLPEVLEVLESPVLMLADATTGKVLVERNADMFQPPASLAKLMTLHLSMKDVEEGRLNLQDIYEVPTGGRATDMRPGSSVLGLRSGDEATLLTFQRAAAIASANDAAWCLALLSSGDSDSFINMMNREARRIGMDNTVYVDPDGWSSLSQTSGRDQMTFAISYLQDHPEALSELHYVKTMTYSDRDSIEYKPEKNNTNFLLRDYSGADGLKTGTIPPTNFQFIATALRNETRLIAIVMGLESDNFTEGALQRSREASELLDWGFSHFITWINNDLPTAEITLRHGKSDTVYIQAERIPDPVTIELNRNDISMELDLPEQLTTPLESGEIVGSAIWKDADGIIAVVPMIVTDDQERRWRLRDFLNLKRK